MEKESSFQLKAEEKGSVKPLAGEKGGGAKKYTRKRVSLD